MHRPNVDEVVNYLSTKLNKIFCDREFVHLVIQDFQGILNNTNKCCVLLFPALEPIYQKAIRYQAEIFDLAVFAVATGNFKSVAVCHKDFIIKQQAEVKEVKSKPKEENIMSEITPKCASTSISSRHKRPERMLYVPPAQRVSRLNKSNSQENPQKEQCKSKTKNKCNNITSLHKKALNKSINEKSVIGESSQDINKSVCDNNLEVEKCTSSRSLETNDFVCKENKQYIFDTNESFTFINNNIVRSLCVNYKISKSELSEFNVLLTDCNKEFVLNNEVSYKPNKLKTFSKYSDCEIIEQCIPFYSCIKYPSVLYILTAHFVSWLPKQPVICANKNCATDSNSRTFPFFDFSIFDTQLQYNFVPVPVLCTNSVDPIDTPSYVTLSDNFNTGSFPFKVMCDNIDCTKYCEFFLSESSEMNPEVQEIQIDMTVEKDGEVNKYSGKHDLPVSDDLKLREFSDNNNKTHKQESTKSESITSDNTPHFEQTEDNSVTEATKSVLVKSCNTVLIISDDEQESKTKKSSEVEQNSNKDTVKNKLNRSTEKPSGKLPTKKNDHEEEKEIMRKAKENINRKTRPIMKYMDDSNDLLPINKDEDDINNWEDLFDDEGQLQGELLSGIVQKVGDDVTIVKAIEDYSAYANKAMENLEHIVELYDFPPTFGTPDIMQAFSFMRSDAIYIKWVDDTHALLVLGSLSQAQRALKQENPLIKVRPMTAASSVSLQVANRSDLKPAMKRPQTNLQTARRLITTHLGAKSRISKEQSAKERNDLKTAREMKKLTRQNEKDAWEGNLRSTVK